MDGDGQGQFGGTGQVALRTFGLSAGVDMRGYIINKQEEGKTGQEADGRRWQLEREAKA